MTQFLILLEQLQRENEEIVEIHRVDLLFLPAVAPLDPSDLLTPFLEVWIALLEEILQRNTCLLYTSDAADE